MDPMEQAIKDRSRAAMAQRAAELGFRLTEDQLNEVFEQEYWPHRCRIPCINNAQLAEMISKVVPDAKSVRISTKRRQAPGPSTVAL